MSASLTVDDLRTALDDLGLSTRGHRAELRQRLKKGRARLASPPAGTDDEAPAAARAAAAASPDAHAAYTRWSPQIDSFLVLDVEATCERGPRERPRAMSFEWPNEIIELPVVLLQWRRIPSSSGSASGTAVPPTTPRSPPTAPRSLSHLHSPSPQRHMPRIPLGPRATSGAGGSPASSLAGSSANGTAEARDAEAEQAGWELYIVDTFHTHVKPSWRPRLTRFCRELTGADQATIDAAPPFPQAVNSLRAFLSRHSLLQAPTGPRGASNRTPTSSPAKPKARMAFGTPGAPGGSVSVPSSPASSSAHAAPALRPGVAWVTHSMHDLLGFIPKQSWISGMEAVPPFLRGPLIDIRKGVPALLDAERTPEPSARKASPVAPRAAVGSTPPTGPASRREPWRDTTIDGLLALLDLGAFEGRQHSGLADTRNIARLVIECARRVGLAAVGASEPASASSSSTASTDKESEDAAPSRERAAPPSRAAQAAATRHALRLERAALVPNTNLDRASAKRWHWMGARPGIVNWSEPEERLTDVEDCDGAEAEGRREKAGNADGGAQGERNGGSAPEDGKASVDVIGALFAKARMVTGINGQVEKDASEGQGGDQTQAQGPSVDGGQGSAQQ